MNDLTLLVDINKHVPELPHRLANLLVLVVSQQEDVWSQSDQVSLQLLVEHDDITQAFCRVFDVLQMAQTAMNLKELINELFTAELIRHSYEIAVSFNFFPLLVGGVVSELFG